MITRNDLDSAVAFRLAGIDAEIAENAALAVYRMSVDTVGPDADKSRMATILVSLGITPKRNASAIWHALMAKGAEMVGDIHAFYLAAYVAFDSHRQARRGSFLRLGDALDGLIRSAIYEFPSFSPSQLWAEFARHARVSGDGVLADYDGITDLISFEPAPGAELREIGFEAFRRRVQRVRSQASD